MGVPTSEVDYTSATARRGDHESSYEQVVALDKKKPNFDVWLLAENLTDTDGPTST